MSVNKVDPDIKPRFNYVICVDIVVLACILVVAGRPDGLTITVSAIIVAVGALIYRCTMGVKSYMTGKSRHAGARHDEGTRRPAMRSAPPARPVDSSADRKSWLRDD